jgi:hypothetical protein
MDITFRTSEHTDQLDEAFAKAQRKFKTAVKNAANPHFKSRFADYEAIIDAGRDALNDEGICVLQPATAKGQGVIVTTTLRFKGQWYASDLEMTATQAGPQALGSCITYAKRYALGALLAIPSGDDDGEAAEGRQTETVRDAPKAPASNVDKVKARVAAANGAAPDRLGAIKAGLERFGLKSSDARKAKAESILGHPFDTKNDADLTALEAWIREKNDATEILGRAENEKQAEFDQRVQ